MPFRTAPKKLKIAVYLTQREKIALETAAFDQQLTLSEWVRTIILRYGLPRGDKPQQAVAAPAAPIFDVVDLDPEPPEEDI